MTFTNYDEEDDFDEENDFDEADNYDEEGEFNEKIEDEFLEDEDEPDTVLSHAFRAAKAIEIEDEEDEEEDKADNVEQDDFDEDDEGDGANEQVLIKPVDELPDEDDDEEGEDEEDEDEEDLEDELPPLELPPSKPEVQHFRPREQSNSAYADAVTAYYEQKNYQRAIEKFDEAIAYEAQRVTNNATDPNEIVAKSKYWQAEAYVKLQDFSQAIGTFEDLVKTCKGHYLALAAQRRADQLNTGNA